MTRSHTHAITLAITLTISLVACSSRTPEQRFVDQAAAALGGRGQILAVDSLVMEGQGSDANLGQDMTWEASGQKFELTNYKRTMAVASGRSRTEQTRTPNFLYFRGPRPQRQVFGIDGDVAYTVAPNGHATRASEAVAEDRQVDFYHHPLTIVRAMLAPSTIMSNVRTVSNGRSGEVVIGDKSFVVSVDADGRPTSVTSHGHHPNMGDVVIETTFADYQEVEGLRLPLRLTTRIDGRTITELQIGRYTLNGDPSDLAAPAAAASAPPATTAAPKVDAIEVASGLWLLGGQSHHSALVEFADHLMLIEAPQSEARTQAVIAKARELVPAKPLTELVVSHHHFDHTGGLRAAIAEGMTVITHEANRAFVEEMAGRQFTRQPDALQKQPRELKIRTVDDSLTLKDSAMEVQLYPLPGNPHGDALLMAYFPRQRVLVEVDAYSPGGAYHPYAANLLQNIQQRQLRVDRIVPLHGAIVPFSELTKAVSAQ